MRNRLTVLAVLAAISLRAQTSEGGLPPSFNADIQALLAVRPVTTVRLPSVDRDAMLSEDSKTPGQTRFAAPVAADISMETHGVWTTLPGGDRLWICSLQSPGALGLTLLFDAFELPAGARLYAYDAGKKQVLGAFTATSNLPSGKFLIGVLKGEQVFLECLVPARVPGNPRIHIHRVDVSYDRTAMSGAEFDYGESLPCNVNINCVAGSNWQNEKRGIARILMVFENGEAWCSGTLIANTTGSYEPYFLTAHHCQILASNPDFDLWRFDFDYEGATCSNPATEPVAKSVLGCSRISYRAETDFMLLKLNPIPPNYNVYFNGWNRDNAATTISPNSTMIHHPFGDIKKITIDTQAAIIFSGTLNWGGVFGTSPANSHWKTIPDVGIQQPGSSGSPLFDSNKRIRGQLHGGSVSQMDPCIMTGVYYGRFNLSWDQGASSAARLKEWLDPNATNATTQNGYARPIPSGFDISGVVKTHWGDPMPGIKVVLSNANGSSTAAYTDPNGAYLFDNVTGGFNYTVYPERDTNDLNGLTTFDLVLVSKHILGITPLDSPWKLIAADVNKSNSVTNTDIVEARKVLLGINNSLPNNTSWRFFPDFAVFPDPNNPFANTLPPNNISITNLQADYPGANFKGVKIGDTNNSAAPGQ